MGLVEDTPRPRRGLSDLMSRWQTDLISRPGFQAWAARFPLTRGLVRRDGERLFDLVAGFVYSQTLFACVQLELFEDLAAAPKAPLTLALARGLTEQRMTALCQSAAALGLIKRRRDGRYALARLGAALIGVPGLIEMVRHHDILYRDMADPVALLRDEVETELAGFWPYVLGQTQAAPEDGVVQQYSRLMAQSQAMVAQETLQTVSFAKAQVVMDVGGGTGAFLRHVQVAYPKLKTILFDLPDVVTGAEGMEAIGGSFLDPLPRAADTITLIRVLYDHTDETVDHLLRNVFDALPAGGRIVISEPMSGGAHPARATDGYFSFYTMAMRTGRVRSHSEIAEKLERVGFADAQIAKTGRPYVTSVVMAEKA
ncbi:MAG: acetylserotonin O-methyltransferase [Rhodobacteraceae bacterium]|nr:acetylserotonin O-methyltransferase [Paracoccaceae bacterium]